MFLRAQPFTAINSPANKREEEKEKLNLKVVRGTFAALLAQIVKFCCQFGTIIILARLLSPTDFGLFGVVFALVVLFEPVKEGGLALSTLQKNEITNAQISNLFWINLGIGALLAILFFIAAPLIGWLYGNPQISSVCAAMSITFFIGGASIQHRALLARRMNFIVIAMVESAAALVSSVLAIVAALCGAQFWALVIYYLCLETLQTVGLWFSSKWKPSLPDCAVSVIPLISFGSYVAGLNFLSYFTHKFQSLVVGWFCGLGQLGIFDRAYQLTALPISQIYVPVQNVAYSSLSRLQSEPERFRRYLTHYLQLAVALGMPFAVFLFVASGEMIEFLFGSQWSESAQIARALAPAAFVLPFRTGVNWMFVTLGKVKKQFYWKLLTTVLIAICLVAGAQWNALGVATAFSTAQIILLVPTLIYACADSPFKVNDFWAASWRPALAALGAAAPLFGWRHYFYSPILFWELASETLIYCVAYLLIWLAVPQGKQILREYWRLFRLLKQ